MVEGPKKEKCTDCRECQICSETRCRVCREERCKKGGCQLGSTFTYGEYLEWKRKQADEKTTEH